MIGVNSFGAESNGTDAEFFFAISTRELLPFLRANDITPQINSLPCRSLADLNAEERQRALDQQAAAEAKARAEEEDMAKRREELRRKIDFEILDERDDGMALALLLLLAALGGAGFAWLSHEDGERQRMKIGAGVALVAILGAGVAWFMRPSFSEGDDRLQDLLREEMVADETGAIPTTEPTGQLICTLVPERSRVISAASQTVPLDWKDDGCVNRRTQYGLDAGTWTRVLVPNTEAAVSVTSYDPASGEYHVDRYLLDRDQMDQLRAARGDYQAPSCGAGDKAAQELGARQTALMALLPGQPNERLVYHCAPGKPAAPATTTPQASPPTAPSATASPDHS